jgi:hypothetical protein
MRSKIIQIMFKPKPDVNLKSGLNLDLKYEIWIRNPKYGLNPILIRI